MKRVYFQLALIALFFIGLTFATHALSSPIATQNRVESITAFLNARGLNIPKVTVDYSELVGYDEDIDATAWPGEIVIRTSYGEALETVFLREQDTGRVIYPAGSALIMHELLHYVQGTPTYLDNYILFERERYLEEAFTDAVMYDLIDQYIISTWHPKPWDAYYQRGDLQPTGSIYRDQVSYVRRLSMKATRSKTWRSKAARQWRLMMETQAFDTRREIINALS